jgi:hypothetical protein
MEAEEDLATVEFPKEARHNANKAVTPTAREKLVEEAAVAVAVVEDAATVDILRTKKTMR